MMVAQEGNHSEHVKGWEEEVEEAKLWSLGQLLDGSLGAWEMAQ